MYVGPGKNNVLKCKMYLLKTVIYLKMLYFLFWNNMLKLYIRISRQTEILTKAKQEILAFKKQVFTFFL